MCNPDIESLFVSITNSQTPYIVGVIYRPPSGNIHLFNEELLHIMTQLPDKNVYILGDFNINLHSLNTPISQQYEENIITSGYFPLISIATHARPNCEKTCIDNILCNSPDNIIVSGTLSDRSLHHSPIFQISKIWLEKSNTRAQKITITHDYSNENIDKFCIELKNSLENSCSIDTFDEFVDMFQTSVDNTCKLDKPKITKRNKICNPWITTGLINAVHKKNRLYKAWKKSTNNRNINGNLSLYEKYKDYRKILRGLIQRAKKMYYVNQFDKFRGNKKKTWEIVNALRGKSKATMTQSICIDNNRITSRRIIANKFNNYFASVARKLNFTAYSEIPITAFPSFQSYLSKSCESSIFLEDCDTNEISNIIRELENNKASDIPIVLVKRSNNIISPILSRLYNQCMILGIFPSMLKVGKITPIHKKGNKELIENYRPISTLPIFGKVSEKIIYSRMYNFFICKGIISDSQFGFRKGHSTSHAVHHSVGIIKQAHRLKKHVIGIFIDLSKAFDTLDHKTLLHKLENSGIRGTANRLMASYLSGREQYTNYLGEKSDSKNVCYGVPQGSVLGPLLFLLYINDVKNCYKVDGCEFVLYADDTNLFIIDNDREAASAKANLVLNSVHMFMKSNLLHINLQKCCYIYFKPPTRSSLSCARTRPFTGTPKIIIDGNVITEVEHTKFLGITIDRDLSWLPHIESLHKKLKSATGILRRIRHNIPKENYKSLYYSLFESHMAYGITVFGGISKNNLDKLFRVQKHCIRILFGDLEKYLDKFKTCARTREFGKQVLGSEFFCKEHTKPLYNTLGILAFYNVYNYQVCLDVLKILKLRLPTALYELFHLSSRNNGTFLITPAPSTDLIYKGSKIWNTAVKILAKQNSIYSIKIGHFKRNLKTCLLEIQKKFDEFEWYTKNFQIETALCRE